MLNRLAARVLVNAVVYKELVKVQCHVSNTMVTTRSSSLRIAQQQQQQQQLQNENGAEQQSSHPPRRQQSRTHRKASEASASVRRKRQCVATESMSESDVETAKTPDKKKRRSAAPSAETCVAATVGTTSLRAASPSVGDPAASACDSGCDPVNTTTSTAAASPSCTGSQSTESEPTQAGEHADKADPVPARTLDIVLCFDVTASMVPVLNSVREELVRLTSTIFDTSVADVRIAVVAHGDYDCSMRLSTLPFTQAAADVRAFIQTVPVAYGTWNEGECYEEALRVCARELEWRPHAKKVVVVVGDDIAHPPEFHMNTARTDWSVELERLVQMDVCVFAVQCASLSVPRAEPFYKALARAHPSGRYLLLTQFYMMSEMVLGIFHSARDDMHALGDHEQTLVLRGMHNAHVARAFASLRGEDPPTSSDALAFPTPSGSVAAPNAQGLVPMAPGRFQVLPVTRKHAIKVFVQKCGAVFRKGSGFYQLTKSEDVSVHKEIVLEHKTSGDMFSGVAVRSILGLPPYDKGKLCPHSRTVSQLMQTYNVFVQSTSYNRTLEPGTRFLYEIDQV